MHKSFAISDLHFSDGRVMEIAKRPFDDIRSMDETLIYNWNQTVKEHDNVYVVGDFCLYTKHTQEIFEALNGNKFLIVGNHDLHDDRIFDLGWQWFMPYYELAYNEMNFVLFHYPILSWHHRDKGYIHLHGHTHSVNPLDDEAILPDNARWKNVSCENLDYKPLCLDVFKT